MEMTQFERMIEQYKRQILEMAARQPKGTASIASAPVESSSAPPLSTPAPVSGNQLPPIGDANNRNPAGQPEDNGDGNSMLQGTSAQSNRPNAVPGGTGIPAEQPPSSIPEAMTYEEFLERNPHWGSLKIQAFTGRAALPVEGVQVSVDRTFSDGPKNFYRLSTDADGLVEDVKLPAPDRSLSQQPGAEQPFATYDITVTHPSYHTQLYRNTPVFDGVKSILPVRMIPKSLPQE